MNAKPLAVGIDASTQGVKALALGPDGPEALAAVNFAKDLPRFGAPEGFVPDADPAALRLAESWAEIVGEDVARRTAPGALERGVLTVSVRGSTWFAELRRSGPRLLLPKINAALGAAPDAPAVRSLRFVPAR